MSEEDVRGGLLDAVADEPPLSFDPDELVATARRQVRRRALVAAGFATVAVVAVAVAVPIALSRAPGTTQVADRPTSVSSPSVASPSPSTEQWPPPNVEIRDYTPGDLRQRGEEMTGHLRGTLPATLPSASDFTYGEFGGEAAGDFYEGQTSINAPVTFTIDGDRYSLVITSWATGAAGPPAKVCVANCHRLDDRAGGAVFQQTDDLGKGVIETVFHYRDNGAMVSVAAYNYDMTSGTPPTYHPSLPLSREQLLTIATDPGLEL